MYSTLVVVGIVALKLAVTGIVTFVICSFVEWYLHAKVLHGPEGTEPHQWHGEHHANFAKPHYKRDDREGDTFGLVPEVFFRVNGLITIAGLVLGLCLSSLLIPLMVTLTSITYFKTLAALHRRVHLPTGGGWFEKTALFKYLDKCHRIHHANDDRFFCIVLPFVADVIMRTTGRSHRQVTEPAHVVQ